MGSGKGGSVIAGNTRQGRLIYEGVDRYIGTRRVGHRMEQKRFNGRRCAVQLEWSKWVEAGKTQESESARRKAALDALEKERSRPREDAGAMKGNDMEAKGKKGGVFALCVVGGAPLYVFDCEDKAFAVCDALTEAAKASGFAAKYDVVEVKRWTE